MRRRFLKGILYAIFPILFNVMFFLLGGTDHPTSVWVSYAWIHAAYLVLIANPIFSKKTQSSHIYRYTTAQISSVYFVVELIIGLIFIFAAPAGVKGAIIIQMIPFCIFLAVFVWNIMSNDRTAGEEQIRTAEISFIKTASSKAKFIMDSTSDAELRRKIEKIYDLIHSSPSRSNPSVTDIENNVMMMIGDLAIAVEDGNVEDAGKLVRKIQFAMDERNRLLSLVN